MAFLKQKRAWAIVTSLFFHCLVPGVAPIRDSSQPAANDIRRRSGFPDGPALAGRFRKRNGGIPIIISNQCGDPLWPAIEMQAVTGPGTGGFLLAPGMSRSLIVGDGWTGRVWGRTDCSFNANLTSSRGSRPACDTGDCGGLISCAGLVRLFLGEFRGIY